MENLSNAIFKIYYDGRYRFLFVSINILLTKYVFQKIIITFAYK